MQPVDGGVVIVGQSFANRSSRESLLVLAHVRSDNGGDIFFLDDGVQPSLVGNIVQQLGPLIGLLKVRRHALSAGDRWMRAFLSAKGWFDSKKAANDKSGGSTSIFASILLSAIGGSWIYKPGSIGFFLCKCYAVFHSWSDKPAPIRGMTLPTLI